VPETLNASVDPVETRPAINAWIDSINGIRASDDFEQVVAPKAKMPRSAASGPKKDRRSPR
jgi:hypothetical protein